MAIGSVNQKGLPKLFPGIVSELSLMKIFGPKNSRSINGIKDWILLLSQIYCMDKWDVVYLRLHKKVGDYNFNISRGFNFHDIIDYGSSEEKETLNGIVIDVLSDKIRKEFPIKKFIEDFVILGAKERRKPNILPNWMPGEMILSKLFLGSKERGLTDKDWIILLAILYDISKLEVLKIFIDNKIKKRKDDIYYNGRELNALEDIWTEWDVQEKESAEQLWKKELIKNFKQHTKSLDNFISVYNNAENRWNLNTMFGYGMFGVKILKKLGNFSTEKFSKDDRIFLLGIIYADEGETIESISKKWDN